MKVRHGGLGRQEAGFGRIAVELNLGKKFVRPISTNESWA
jgi:hypothetical protein